MHFQRQIRNRTFIPDEPEMKVISDLVKPGDWVIDVGANVGHYTLHMAACVGATGRVFAFEPLPETFALLTANVQAADTNNVTLINAAASNQTCISNMSVPKSQDHGMDNLYRAHLEPTGDHPVFCMPLDSMPHSQPIKLIKIDAEGYDLEVLEGAEKLILAHKPIVIAESKGNDPITEWLVNRGYLVTKAAPNSPNIVARVV